MGRPRTRPSAIGAKLSPAAASKAMYWVLGGDVAGSSGPGKVRSRLRKRKYVAHTRHILESCICVYCTIHVYIYICIHPTTHTHTATHMYDLVVSCNVRMLVRTCTHARACMRACMYTDTAACPRTKAPKHPRRENDENGDHDQGFPSPSLTLNSTLNPTPLTSIS